MIARPLGLGVGLATLALACAPPPIPPDAPSPSPRAALSPVGQRCDEGAYISGDLGADLERLVRGCGLRQRPLTPPQVGHQTSADKVSRFSFPAGGPGLCYRVYAVASPGVSELAAMLRDPAGKPILRSDARAPFLVLPAAAPLCLPEAGEYTLDLAVTAGEGNFALEVWEDQGPPPRRRRSTTPDE